MISFTQRIMNSFRGGLRTRSEVDCESFALRIINSFGDCELVWRKILNSFERGL